MTRSDIVYELFLTHLPQDAFTAADVVALYLHRGAFEAALADEEVQVEPGHAPTSPPIQPTPLSRAKPSILSPVLGRAAGTQCPRPIG